MRCTSPRTVGFLADGKTITWSSKNFIKEFATFQLPCGKCIECRLDYARQWAVRCVHESQMHTQNCFITLTYSPENLKSPKLIYSDYQKFMKRLRKRLDLPIGCFVTGEYGDLTKRPHYHAIIFGWCPPDGIYKYSNARGDEVRSSAILDSLWGLGITEYGTVTFESAGYCARYAAKKLAHGKDDDHDFHPISKKSSKHAIGKKWLELYWPDVFNAGKIILKNGTQCSIPRYYEKWLQKNQPEAWEKYVTKLKAERAEKILARVEQEKLEEITTNDNRRKRQGQTFTPVITAGETKKRLSDEKFKLLQSYLKY